MDTLMIICLVLTFWNATYETVRLYKERIMKVVNEGGKNVIYKDQRPSDFKSRLSFIIDYWLLWGLLLLTNL